MDSWFFTEQAHTPAWDKYPGALRGDIPGKYGDPEVSSQLLNTYWDQYVLADQLGMNIMVNEHHVASTCMNPSVTLTLAALARQTKRARLLGLGSIISNRPDPLRVAEEYAVVDCISGGRLDMGMVKGAGWELFASNANPVGYMERFWEAHDLIIAAMTGHEEQFSWEGEHFDYREVNLWPRAVQRPHPPVWFTANGPAGARLAAEKGYRSAAFLAGLGAKPAFEAYRETYQAQWGKPAEPDRLAYLGLVAAARTREDCDRRILSMRAYLASVARMREAHVAPPGYAPVDDFVRQMRAPKKAGGGFNAMEVMTDQQLADAGVMFWGEPEQIYDQICKYNETMGGFGHFLMMGQAADMSDADARDNLTLFGEHVAPKLAKFEKFAAPQRSPVTA
jgi:alkanesulfonate monooxygenase SsuD/methylene tetrahydromethanopterin reductase-like flavin-dependent oxidoreductase (luciferase family)